MRFFFVLISLYSSCVFATMDPWYSVQNIDKLEINLYFVESSIEIKEFYKFHLGMLGEVLKANPELTLVVSHGQATPFSNLRSQALYDYFSKREGVPTERVVIENDLSAKYRVLKGERILVSLKYKQPRKQKLKPEVVKPAKSEYKAKIDSEKYLVPPENIQVYSKKTKVKARAKTNWFSAIGLGHREYAFSGRSNFAAYVLKYHRGYKFTNQMQFKMDTEFVYPDVNAEISPEYEVKMGFDALFDGINLKSRLYYKNNFILPAGVNEFESVDDYGLSQKIEFYILNFESFALTLGLTGDISFSNNFSDVESANVYEQKTDVQMLIKKWKLKTSVYFTEREYKAAGDVLKAKTLGASLSLEF